MFKPAKDEAALIRERKKRQEAGGDMIEEEDELMGRTEVSKKACEQLSKIYTEFLKVFKAFKEVITVQVSFLLFFTPLLARIQQPDISRIQIRLQRVLPNAKNASRARSPRQARRPRRRRHGLQRHLQRRGRSRRG